ncbi:MAG: hypothetical protein AMS18_01270 [Gemmatimonas sp. SG8_17]|nr:MAG: hypothetical protein AMS18_01270 [Gemmatimonas sp. SG8_17]
MNQRLSLAELRAAWLMLGLVTAVVFVVPALGRLMWTTLAGVPWLVGAVLVVGRQRGERIAAAWNETLQTRGARVAVLVIILLIALVSYLFSVSAGVFLALWCALAGLAAGSWLPSERLREGVTGVATMAVACVLVLSAAELVLRSPPFGRRFGSPAELAAWDDRYDQSWQRNVFGFRSHHETVARKPGVSRIITLGDSFTWGDKIARTEDIWPSRLEEGLGQAYPGTAVEVINMGRSGFTTANEAEHLRRLGWQFDPDLVVIQFLANDALPSTANFGSEGEVWLFPQHSLLPVRFRSGPVQSSALLSFLDAQYNGLRLGGDPYRRYFDLYERDSLGWRQLQDALAEIADSAAARRVPLVLMIFPSFIPGTWTAESHPLSPLYRKVRVVAEEIGFQVLDLSSTFAEGGGDWRRWWATPYDRHPSPEAHAAAAKALQQEIAKGGWLHPAGIASNSSVEKDRSQ